MDLTKAVLESTLPPNRGNALIKATTSSCLLTLMAASLILSTTSGPLPLSYFMLLSVATATLLIETLFLPSFGTRESSVVLLQLSVIMAFARLAETFRFASIPGYDTYAHRAVIQGILQNGRVDIGLGTSSAAFPAMSLLVAQFLQIGGIDERTAFALTSMLGVVAIVFLFLIARLFIAPRWAMIASVTLSGAPFFKWWTEVEISPTTIGILLALVMLYAFLKETQRRSVSLWSLGTIAMLGLIISHPIPTLLALLTLLCVVAFQVIGLSKPGRTRSLAGSALLTAVATVAYWMFLDRTWEVSVSVFYSVLTAGAPYFPLRPWPSASIADRFLGDLPWAIIIGGAIYSGIKWLRPPLRSPLRSGWASMSAGIVLMSGASILAGGDVGDFTNRWLLWAEIATCLLFVDSLRVLVARKGQGWRVVAIGLITVVLVSSSVSPRASLYEGGSHPILAFSEGEVKGMAFGANCPQTIVADSYSATYLHFTYDRPTADLYGYAMGIHLNATHACILVQPGSAEVYTKTIRGTSELGVDDQDFAPGLAELPADFQSRLRSEWSLEKVYDDGDNVWYYAG